MHNLSLPSRLVYSWLLANCSDALAHPAVMQRYDALSYQYDLPSSYQHGMMQTSAVR